MKGNGIVAKLLFLISVYEFPLLSNQIKSNQILFKVSNVHLKEKKN